MQFKFFLALALAWVAAGPALAQVAPLSPAAQAGVASQAQRMAQELGLSAEQHARLRNVLVLTRQHMDADLKTHHEDPAALKAAMAFDRAKSDELIRGVLTPAQYVRYQQYKAARIGQLHTTSQVGR
jgi:Spy/CpxP family protein refolding chaperone